MNQSTFYKYQLKGSYHLDATLNARLKGYDPRLHARYQVAIDKIKLAGNVDKVLDVGCGDGVMVFELLKSGYTAYGVDLDREALKLLAEASSDTHFQQSFHGTIGNCLRLPFPDDCFDAITLLEVIEHIPEYNQLISELSRVLKPNGLIVITTPNKIKSEIPAMHCPYHTQEFTGEELAAVVSKCFKNIKILGMYPYWLDYLYKNKNILVRLPTRLLLKPLAKLGVNIFKFTFGTLDAVDGLLAIGYK